MEKEYTYILTIGDKVVKPVAVGWWSTEEDMVTTRCGMATAARAFRKRRVSWYMKKRKIPTCGCSAMIAILIPDYSSLQR